MKFFVNAFLLWLILAVAAALIYPPSFAWFRLSWIDPLLGLAMLGMGLGLTGADFLRVAQAPRAILLGVLLQYTLMPASGYLVANAFQLETPLAVGLILLACCPGGTASNVISYIAKADVALSVSMTMLSTLSAVLVTPLLTTWLVGSRIELDPRILIASTAKVVVLPVILGVLMRRFLPRVSAVLIPIAPAVAVICIILIVAGIACNMRERLLQAGLLLIVAVGIVHTLGALLGYAFSRGVGSHEQVARTVSIEVAMQNAGLGISLANSGAFENPLVVSLPCVFGSLASCLIGSTLAALWSNRPLERPSTEPKIEGEVAE